LSRVDHNTVGVSLPPLGKSGRRKWKKMAVTPLGEPQRVSDAAVANRDARNARHPEYPANWHLARGGITIGELDIGLRHTEFNPVRLNPSL
jgi:hypothetical protein